MTLTWLVGGGAVALLLPVWLLFLAWRFDNHTGSLILLAILFLVVAGILAGLIVLLAIGH